MKRAEFNTLIPNTPVLANLAFKLKFPNASHEEMRGISLKKHNGRMLVRQDAYGFPKYWDYRLWEIIPRDYTEEKK